MLLDLPLKKRELFMRNDALQVMKGSKGRSVSLLPCLIFGLSLP